MTQPASGAGLTGAIGPDRAPARPHGGAGRLEPVDRRAPRPSTVLAPFLPAEDRWTLYVGLAALLAAAALLPVATLRAVSGTGAAAAALPALAGEMGLIHLAWSDDLPRYGWAINRATALTQSPLFFHPWWWALGWATHTLHELPPDVRWAALAALFAGLALAGLRILLRTVLLDGQTRALAVILLVLCGGWRWLHFLAYATGLAGRTVYYAPYWSPPLSALKQGTVFGAPLVDVWLAPDRLGIVAAEAILLACAVRAMLATSWHGTLLNWLGAALALASLQPLAPVSFPIAVVATGLASIPTVVRRQQPASRKLLSLAGFALALGVGWLVHRWYVALPATEPAWALLWTRADGLLVHPGHIFVALGSVAAGGLAWGVVQVAGGRTSLSPPAATLLLSWAICGVWFPSCGYFGIDRLRNTETFAAVPLAVLAADLLVVGASGAVSRRVLQAAVGVAIVTNLPSLGYYAHATIAVALDQSRELAPGDVNVLAHLRRTGMSGDLALTSDAGLDRLVLSLTDKRVGAGWLTELHGHARLLRREFFVDPGTPQRQADLLEALGVRFVLYRSDEVRAPHPSPLLSVVASGPKLTLLAVHPPEEPTPHLQAGDLVRSAAGDVHVYDGRRRRLVPNIETFVVLGYDWKQVQPLSGWQLAAIPEGYPLPSKVPTGQR